MKKKRILFYRNCLPDGGGRSFMQNGNSGRRNRSRLPRRNDGAV